MQIIDGKKIRDKILENVQQEVVKLPFQPLFCDILVGDDPASIQYVGMKKRSAEKVGISFYEANFPASITTDELVAEIKKINEVPNMCGVIVQLPLPPHIDRQKVLDAIDSNLDVDCLSSVASEKFYKSKSELGYPTALACLAVLDSLKLDLENKKIAVLGQGLLVGRPVSAMLSSRGLSPIEVDSKTTEKEKVIIEADIIVSGIGEGKYLTGDMIKPGAVIIDAGTSEENGAIVGDVDLDSIRDVAEYVSPVPGGVGPVTVAMLLQNVVAVAKKLANKKYE